MTKHLWVGLIMAALPLMLGAASAAGQQADARLQTFFRQYLEQSFRLRPLDATRLGDHRFDHLLDDLSAKARADWVAHLRKALDDLPRQVDVARLSPAGRIDFEIFHHELVKSLWITENLDPLERDPRAYGEYINDSVFLLLTQSTLPKETNLTHAIARMARIPQVVAAAGQTCKTPAGSPGNGHRAEPGLDRLLREGHLRAGRRDAAERRPARRRPSGRRLPERLPGVPRAGPLPRANGHWRLGKEKFAKKLDLELDAGLTAEQVLAAAEADFVRVQRELYLTARQLWGRYFPLRALPPDNAGRRLTVTEVIRAVSREHGRPEDLTADARATVARIRRFIRDRKILRLPEPDRCQVIEMPEFKRGNSTAYMDAAPPLDAAAEFLRRQSAAQGLGRGPGRSLLEEYNRHMLQVLTIHEAYPGHYVQLAYANRNPSLIRRVLGSGVYIEGWAVYCEQMMLDQGYGDGDLALRLMQLKFQLRTVINAILDHKMHCTTMSDDEALSLLVDRAYQSEGEARLKIIRAKQTSCQLSTYFVGRTAMLPLRRELQHGDGRPVRPRPLPRGRAGPGLGAGEVLAGAGAGDAEALVVRLPARISHVAWAFLPVFSASHGQECPCYVCRHSVMYPGFAPPGGTRRRSLPLLLSGCLQGFLLEFHVQSRYRRTEPPTSYAWSVRTSAAWVKRLWAKSNPASRKATSTFFLPGGLSSRYTKPQNTVPPPLT